MPRTQNTDKEGGSPGAQHVSRCPASRALQEEGGSRHPCCPQPPKCLKLYCWRGAARLVVMETTWRLGRNLGVDSQNQGQKGLRGTFGWFSIF